MPAENRMAGNTDGIVGNAVSSPISVARFIGALFVVNPSIGNERCLGCHTRVFNASVER